MSMRNTSTAAMELVGIDLRSSVSAATARATGSWQVNVLGL